MYISLDIARGIAALGVFLFHIRVMLDGPLPFIAKLAAFGSLGVPLFFVISGYVITASAESIRRRALSPSAFVKARLRRIYPPFWASILVVCAAPYLIEAVSAIKTGHYLRPSPAFLSLSPLEWLQLCTLSKVFTSQDGDLQGAFNMVNSVYWTLAIEIQFYLIVYAALFTRTGFRPILAVVTVASLAVIWIPPDLNPGLFIFFWPMFAVGIALYYVNAYGFTLDRLLNGRGAQVPLLLVVLLLGAWMLVAYYDRLAGVLSWFSPSPGFSFALWCGLVFWCAAALEPRLLHARNHGHAMARHLIGMAAFLGVISYSVYLLHGKVNQLPTMLARQLLSPQSALLPVATITGTLLICALFYYYIEKPFMSVRQREINSRVLDGETPSPLS